MNPNKKSNFNDKKEKLWQYFQHLKRQDQHQNTPYQSKPSNFRETLPIPPPPNHLNGNSSMKNYGNYSMFPPPCYPMPWYGYDPKYFQQSFYPGFSPQYFNNPQFGSNSSLRDNRKRQQTTSTNTNTNNQQQPYKSKKINETSVVDVDDEDDDYVIPSGQPLSYNEDDNIVDNNPFELRNPDVMDQPKKIYKDIGIQCKPDMLNESTQTEDTKPYCYSISCQTDDFNEAYLNTNQGFEKQCENRMDSSINGSFSYHDLHKNQDERLLLEQAEILKACLTNQNNNGTFKIPITLEAKVIEQSSPETVDFENKVDHFLRKSRCFDLENQTQCIETSRVSESLLDAQDFDVDLPKSPQDINRDLINNTSLLNSDDDSFADNWPNID